MMRLCPKNFAVVPGSGSQLFANRVFSKICIRTGSKCIKSASDGWMDEGMDGFLCVLVFTLPTNENLTS